MNQSVLGHALKFEANTPPHGASFTQQVLSPLRPSSTTCSENKNECVKPTRWRTDTIDPPATPFLGVKLESRSFKTQAAAD